MAFSILARQCSIGKFPHDGINDSSNLLRRARYLALVEVDVRVFVGDAFVAFSPLFCPSFCPYLGFCDYHLGDPQVLLLLGCCQVSSRIGLSIQPVSVP